MSEKALRKYVTGLIDGHVSQIESHATSAGIPDTNALLAISGLEVWLELKYTVNGKPFKVRNTQKTWFRRRCRTGATNLYIMWRADYQGKIEHGIIEVTNHNVDDVFRDTSVFSWKNLSICRWGREVPSVTLNMILGGQYDTDK